MENTTRRRYTHANLVALAKLAVKLDGAINAEEEIVGSLRVWSADHIALDHNEPPSRSPLWRARAAVHKEIDRVKAIRSAVLADGRGQYDG